MALSVPIATPYGVPASYHRIVNVATSYAMGEVQVAVASYPTEAERQAGADPIQQRFYSFVFADLGDEAAAVEPSRPLLYGKLKTLAEFAEASDA